MTYAETILPEFDQEMANTRKVLERIPDDKLDWQPHPKSHTIGWNANHVADIPNWLVMVLNDAVARYRSSRRPGLYISEAKQSTGDPRSLRPERRGRAKGDHRGEGRGQLLVALAGRQSDLHHAALGRDPLDGPQPLDPSPRPSARLSPPERHPGPRHVRAVGRRMRRGRSSVAPADRKGSESEQVSELPARRRTNMIAKDLNPILNVSDIQESFAWFEKLGWTRGFEWGKPPDFGSVCSGECEIFLCEGAREAEERASWRRPRATASGVTRASGCRSGWTTSTRSTGIVWSRVLKPRCRRPTSPGASAKCTSATPTDTSSASAKDRAGDVAPVRLTRRQTPRDEKVPFRRSLKHCPDPLISSRDRAGHDVP